MEGRAVVGSFEGEDVGRMALASEGGFVVMKIESSPSSLGEMEGG
jgi:hypothetical protein